MSNQENCCLAPSPSLVPWSRSHHGPALMFQYKHSNLRGPVEAVCQEEGCAAACLCDGLLFILSILFLFLPSSPLPWKDHEVWLAGVAD